MFSRKVGGRFLLISRRGATARRLPVPAAGVPFDAVVWRDRRHTPVVLYSRCGSDRPSPEAPALRLRCRLGSVRADASAEPRPLGPPPRRGISHRWPSMDGGVLSFVRVPDRPGDGAVIVGHRVALRLRGLTGPGSVFGLATSEHRIAVSFDYTPDPEEDSPTAKLVLLRPGHRREVVMTLFAGIENDPLLLTPQFRSNSLLWGLVNHDAYNGRQRAYLYKRTLGSGRTTATRLHRYATSVAVDPGGRAPILVSTESDPDALAPEPTTQAIQTVAEPTESPPGYRQIYLPLRVLLAAHVLEIVGRPHELRPAGALDSVQ